MMAIVDMLPCAVQGQSPTSHGDRLKRQTFIERLRRSSAKGPKVTESQWGSRVPRNNYQGMAGSLVKVKVTPGS
jgi:hypothetical protein